MTETRTEVDRLVDELKRQRDELRVQLHLARADARDEWARLEKKWEHARERLDAVRHEAAESGKDVLAATRLVLREIKEGYDRIRAAL